MSIDVYAEHCPIVVIRGFGRPTDTDYQRLIDAFVPINAEWSAHVSLVDMRDLQAAPNAAQRKLLTDWGREARDTGINVSLGNAIVLVSPLLRGALTAMGWMYKATEPRTLSPGPRRRLAVVFAAAQRRRVAPPELPPLRELLAHSFPPCVCESDDSHYLGTPLPGGTVRIGVQIRVTCPKQA